MQGGIHQIKRMQRPAFSYLYVTSFVLERVLVVFYRVFN